MSILNEIMSRYAMPDNITNFLDSMREKIARQQGETQGCNSVNFDELYGILPVTSAIRHDRETRDENLRAVISQWNLSEILILQNHWDNMKVTLWKQDGCYYCMKLKLFQKEWTVSVTPDVNLQEAEELFPIVSRRLKLLASAFGNTPLRQLGIRQYIHELMKQAGSELKQNFYLELFLTIFHLKLTAEELANQDIFLKRAVLHCKSIIAMRARCGVKTEAAKMAGMAAARGSGALLDELFVPINMTWGFLANHKALENLSIPDKGKFCFHEYYDTKGNIELGEIFPASKQEKSLLKIQHKRDCYIQVFPDYQSALTFRNIAFKLIQSSNSGRKI